MFLLIYILFIGGFLFFTFRKPLFILYFKITKDSQKALKYKWRYRSRSGFKKKRDAVISLLLGGIVIVLFTYTGWYFISDHSTELTLNANNDILETKNNSGESIFYINPKSPIHKKLTESVNSNSLYFGEYFFKFIELKGGLLTILLSLFSLISIIAGFYQWNKYEKFSLLFEKSKEKIKILNKFSKNSFSLFNSSSIYQSIIDLLERSLVETNNQNNVNTIKLRMLLCSPLIDYPGRCGKDLEKWGEEFINIVHNLANSRNKAHLEIYHLPNEVVSGINPLKNFTEVLSKYIEDKTKLSRQFSKIWGATEKNIERLNSLSNDININVSLNKTPLVDIPFQLIISKTKSLEEVIVFFAGKRNLENKNVTSDPNGFHSVDPIVVETFSNIFDDCVKPKISPIRPNHTEGIIEELEKMICHPILNYLNTTQNDLFDGFEGININIPEKTFSPAKANSSKFTSRVIQETINKNDTVLEIGSGSGVQSIVAYKTIQKIDPAVNPVIHSVEMEEVIHDCMVENFKDNGISSIVAHKGQLTENAKIVDINNTDNEIDFLTNTFSYVIADLPFTDAKCRIDNKLDKAFFDDGHKLQQALFKFFKNSHLIKKKAKLITSFSSLGGEDDILSFEIWINENELVPIKKVSFIESHYEWITYIIMKKNEVDKRYWWNHLNSNIK